MEFGVCGIYDVFFCFCFFKVLMDEVFIVFVQQYVVLKFGGLGIVQGIGVRRGWGWYYYVIVFVGSKQNDNRQEDWKKEKQVFYR